MKTLHAAILSIGVVFSGYFIGHGLSNLRAHDHYVNVKGLAEQTVLSDEAIWNLNVGYASENQESLYSGMKSAQNQIISFLIAQGFNRSEISIQPISIIDRATQNYDYHGSNQTRYSASGTITLVAHDINKVGTALQNTEELLKAKVILTSNTVTYNFTKLNEIKPELIDTATINARKAAQQFAKNSGNHIGKIREASQGQISINSADGSYTNDSPMKKIRVVTSVTYDLI